MTRIALTMAAIGLAASAASAQVFTETFDNNNAGWTLDQEWMIGAATASTGHQYGNPDPDHDATNTFGGGVAGVVIGGNADTTLHGYYYLTSPVIPLAPGSYSLDFARWLNSDYTPYMQNTIEVFDGSAWQTLWSSGGSPGVQDAAWTQISHDISAFANANFRVRFGHQVGSTGAYVVSSWNIDNVSIIPAPGALALLGMGLGIAARRRR